MLKARPQAEWTVHRAVPADAQRLTPLCAAHADYERCAFDATGHTERLQSALANAQVHMWWLEGAAPGVAQGYASVTLDWATLSARPYAHMDCLYLCESARGQGAGHLLVEAVCAFARAQACGNVQWQTPDWNDGAIRFYQRLGAQSWVKQRFALALAP